MNLGGPCHRASPNAAPPIMRADSFMQRCRLPAEKGMRREQAPGGWGCVCVCVYAHSFKIMQAFHHCLAKQRVIQSERDFPMKNEYDSKLSQYLNHNTILSEYCDMLLYTLTIY